jgi:hypothetical protein
MRGLLATVLRNYEIKVDQSCLSCEDNRSVREESTSLVRENTFRERVGTVACKIGFPLARILRIFAPLKH